MIKRLLYLTLILTVGISVKAQSLVELFTTRPLSAQVTAETGNDFIQIGNCEPEMVSRTGLGTRTATKVYTQIPRELLARYVGKQLTKVKIGIGNTNAQTATLNLSYGLTESPFYEQTFSVQSQNWNEITLGEEYIIEDKDLFIGYSIVPTSTNDYPIGLDSGPAVTYGGWIYYQNQWLLLPDGGIKRNLSIIGVVEGENLPQHDAQLKSVILPPSFIEKDSNFTINGIIKNNGVKDITNFDITYQIGDSEPVTKHFDQANITNYHSIDFTITDATYSLEGQFPITVIISGINGNEDEYENDNTLISSLSIISDIPSIPTLVKTEPSNRNIVIEEYTGNNCGWCPAGHKTANEISDLYPERVVTINIHQGMYAANYTTDWGDALAAQTGLTGYPAGTINRHFFSQNKTDVAYTTWKSLSPRILEMNSCVNMASISEINKDTREMIVTVEAYYTANSDSATNMLNVAILQDSIIGRQEGANKYPAMIIDGSYQHNHMLRDLITRQWGEEIATTTEGSFIFKKYRYVFPDQIGDVPVNLDKMKVVAFIAEGKQEILTGVESEMTYKGGPVNILDSKNNDFYSGSFVSNGFLYINIESKDDVSIDLYSIDGKVVKSLIKSTSGKEALAIPISGLEKGIYIVRISDGKKVISEKIAL